MKKKVWELLKKRFKTEKEIQDFIIEGVVTGLAICGCFVFVLVIIAIMRSLGA